MSASSVPTSSVPTSSSRFRLAVFCGSAEGNSPVYGVSAFALGKLCAEQQIGIVYGGAQVGLMGAVADGALRHGGEVIGVIPTFLRTKEIAHDGVTELIQVETMHERKMIMSTLCDGVVILPGGFGTMDEMFEMLTWSQLGLHSKPIALLNLNGFYNGLIDCMQTMVKEGFLQPNNHALLSVHTDIDTLVRTLEHQCLSIPPPPTYYLA